MRKFLLALIFCAVILHFFLHYIVQMSKNNWVPVADRKDDHFADSCFNQNFKSLLQMPNVRPFICPEYAKQATEEGSKKLDLPYGIRNGERYLRLVFSKLKNCNLPSEINVPCRKCVVVGNGGVLRNKTLGSKIDSYDVIIRMNDAPVVGYEEDVGRKTTFRFCYPESIFSDPQHYDENTTIVLLAFKPHDVKWLSELLLHKRASTFGFWRKPALKMMYDLEQIRILNPTLVRKVAHGLLHFPKRFPKKEKPKHPTTGIIGITFALHICNEVHIAGFKYNLTSQNSSLHYYGNDTMFSMTKTEYHNITAEQMLLKGFIEKNTIVNLTPD
ncbi:type 2 lactosamine alpha-2,3-sialyltransferase isoform X2 [Ambystoma mexicanum]|uniref:type 2 lactosamine alpha-2,3-sialyltransferase isoform X2 n=1 Tax=Ambystoma mexicanum TaxID=8296 RepID=UPI0037E90067